MGFTVIHTIKKWRNSERVGVPIGDFGRYLKNGFWNWNACNWVKSARFEGNFFVLFWLSISWHWPATLESIVRDKFRGWRYGHPSKCVDRHWVSDLTKILWSITGIILRTSIRYMTRKHAYLTGSLQRLGDSVRATSWHRTFFLYCQFAL
jgi:hypothetical protein